MMISNTKTLWSPWFIHKYSSAVRVKASRLAILAHLLLKLIKHYYSKLSLLRVMIIIDHASFD